MDDPVEIKAVRYGRRRKSRIRTDEDDAYRREPFKFLWTYSGDKSIERQKSVLNSDRMDVVQEHVRGRKVVGTVLQMREAGMPGFGSIYQQDGSNFILHSDNITRVLKIPYYPKAYETTILSPKSFYIDAVFNVFYTCNIMNLIITSGALIAFIMDIYYLIGFYPRKLIVFRYYLVTYLLVSLIVAFVFAIGHNVSKQSRTPLAFLYVYIFLCLITTSALMFFHCYYKYTDYFYYSFSLEGRAAITNDAGLREIDRLQRTLKCCGIAGHSDWASLRSTSLPITCCDEQDFMNYTGYFNCDPQFAYPDGCARVTVNHYKNMLLTHEYMLFGSIFFQWILLVLAMVLALAIVNGAMDITNNINYKSNPGTEYFNIVTKGEVEFFLPMACYENKRSENYKYMILLNDIRKAINDRQKKHLYDNKHMMFDVV